MTTMNPNAPTKPMIGELTSGMRTLLTTPLTWMAAIPPPANEAPSSPPIRAWLDELGMPSRQVMRFQTIPPTSAAITTSSFGLAPVPGSGSGLTRPDAIVTATAVPVRAPTKLAVADRMMACSGLSARVETDVAIALAVSWKPLM